MEKKIKQFFQKKKVEAKFKLAGPGHKLSEASSRSSTESGQREKMEVEKRAGLTEESKVAAEAALARLSLKKENPAFNTSSAFIQAQVKRELESEEASSSKVVEEQEENESEGSDKEVDSINFAVSGVYFKCPIIDNRSLPRDKWREIIREFLDDMKENDLAEAGAVILKTCNSNKEKIDLCVETLSKYIENLIAFPDEEKYHKIRMSNKVFRERVLCLEGALDILHAAGYREQMLPFEDGETEFLVFNKANISSMDCLKTVLEQVGSSRGIPLVLDRGRRVMMSVQGAQGATGELPPSFYALSPEEIKNEQKRRTEIVENSQLLRTKAMREKEELREMRKYRYALIRVRFPPGIILQGTFSVYERYNDIHKFVHDCLELTNFPFDLITPTGQKLSIENDGDKSLIDLRLVPKTLLHFAWHSSVEEDIRNSPSKDVYLKNEFMSNDE